MEVYTPFEVATNLKSCEETILRMLREGKIKGFKVGNRWRITSEELERVKGGK
jgi:excisionase family DNA binding protein